MQQNSGRASLSNYGRRRRCCREEGRQGNRVRPPLPPLPLYRCIRGGEGAALPLPPRKGCGQEGGGVHPPQGTSEVPSPLWTLPSPSFLGARALGAGAPWPKQAKAHPLRPMWPTKAGGPTWWTPGPLRWSRYNTDNTETCPDGQNSTSYI